MAALGPARVVRSAGGLHMGRIDRRPILIATPSSALSRTVFQRDRSTEPHQDLSAVDPATAKTLVSVLLVVAITLFSLFSFRMFVSEVFRDLKAGRARRALPQPEAGERAPNVG